MHQCEVSDFDNCALVIQEVIIRGSWVASILVLFKLILQLFCKPKINSETFFLMFPVFFFFFKKESSLAVYTILNMSLDNICILLKVQAMSRVANVHVAQCYGKQLGSHEQSWKS